MYRINNEDANKILSLLQEANLMIQGALEQSDDGEISMDIDIACDCHTELQEMSSAIGDAILD